jgi:beta-galactosidase
MKKPILFWSLFLLMQLLFGCNNLETDQISLNGTWQFSMKVPESFEKNSNDPEKWKDIQVPGECQMQGFAIKHDKPFAYKKDFKVPAHFKNKDIFLCFEGVYSYARVWVNGKYVRDHSGGFTPWECNITSLVKPGSNACVILEVTDKINEQSYASGYAKHQIGGILRDVYIKVLSQNRINSFDIKTSLDSEYKNAILEIDLSLQLTDEALLTVSLKDPRGGMVKLTDSMFKLKATNGIQTLKFPVANPLKWDAEHPRLYTLNLDLAQKGATVQALTHKVGFRKIEVRANQLLVNGRPVKLRGLCRHDIHLLGRIATADYDLRDVQLAKEANVNFIRTSHYPPTRKFASLCDSTGIYLEIENAACFVRFNRSSDYDTIKHFGSEFGEPLMSQAKEMIQTFRNNPSVIIWSLGNESMYDDNFQQEYNYIKSTDSSRPVIFSYPGTVPVGKKCFDILSMHYPTYTGNVRDQNLLSMDNFGNDSIPTLNDEWAHVPCYNKSTLQIDVNVREFWGRSLDSMWINSFNTKGSLGGAIWGMVDETFMMPDTLSGFNVWWGINPKESLVKYESRTIGYGEWGIVDVWRRKKPEFWSVKKAYSPIRVLTKEVKHPVAKKQLQLEVMNRFNHTNLNEIRVKWEYEGLSGFVSGANIESSKSGIQSIPAQNWKPDSKLKVSFYTTDNLLIDLYEIPILKTELNFVNIQGKSSTVKIIELTDIFLVKGSDYEIQFDKVTGLIKSGIYKGDTLLKGGPFIQYGYMSKKDANFDNKLEFLPPDWKLKSISQRLIKESAEVSIKGSYANSISATFILTISGNGEIVTSYSIEKLSKSELFELGINYLVSDKFNKLIWKRESYWPAYPEGHLGRSSGEEPLHNLVEEKYRELPKKEWVYDVCNFYYKGIDNPLYRYHLPNIITALKENIYEYTLASSNSANSLSVVSNASIACRVEQIANNKFYLVVNNLWDYPDLNWGNYIKAIHCSEKYANSIVIKFKQL